MARQRFAMTTEAVLGISAVAVVAVVVAAVWGGTELAGLAGLGVSPPHNPVKLLVDLLQHRFSWRGWDTYYVIVVLVALASAGSVAGAMWWATAPRHHIDHRARLLHRDARAMRRYTDPTAGPAAKVGDRPVIGTDVVGRRVVRSTWEDVAVVVAGARMRKTTTWVIPHVLAAPGPVYVTSNKRDVVDMTRAPRSVVGTTWLYDPQAIAGGEPTWWWNPLDMASDVAGALSLAGLFAAATRPVGSTMDSYFDPEGESLLAQLLLAAHHGALPLTDVYRWVTDPRETMPVDLLTEAGHELAAAGVQGIIDQPERQRAGVYGTAKKMVGFMVDKRLAQWCVADESNRPQFSAAAFATSKDTVYALSREGPGSAGPLTAAFTAGVMQAAEEVAARSPGGRLAVPLMPVLDEVANVCRWRDLPDLYSHYGSRGIPVECFLQSWSQGVECWGREGMAKLWSAANIRIYGGGANEDQFLEGISKVCGEAEVVTESASDGGYGHSRSQSLRRERVFDVGTLAEVPLGRAVVMLSGAPAVVVRTTSCLEGELAPTVGASMERHGAPAELVAS
jgi:type IV secretory pathway TraG/TraD family ATPase VirD4